MALFMFHSLPPSPSALWFLRSIQIALQMSSGVFSHNCMVYLHHPSPTHRPQGWCLRLLPFTRSNCDICPYICPTWNLVRIPPAYILKDSLNDQIPPDCFSLECMYPSLFPLMQ